MQKDSVFSDFYCLPKQVSAYGAAPHYFRPMYAPRQAGAGEANVGQPSRQEGFVLCPGRLLLIIFSENVADTNDCFYLFRAQSVE
jgi:hypothetical protein